MNRLLFASLLFAALLGVDFAEPQRGFSKPAKPTQEPKVVAKDAESPKANAGDCQQNEIMNRLLLQLLLSSMTTTTTQNPLMANLNRILNPNAIGQVQQQPATAVTQVVTTTAISTVTQLFSTVLSVIYQNRRIPTTVYSSDVVVVTELITQTVTAPVSQEPTALFRNKREDHVEESVGIEPSIRHEPDSAGQIQPTQPLVPLQYSSFSDELNQQYWAERMNHPQVREAWNFFLQALENAL